MDFKNLKAVLVILFVLILFGGVVYFSKFRETQTTLTTNSQTEATLPTDTTIPSLATVIRLSGEVRKGETFEKEAGPNLFFRLIPEDLGWTISVGSKISKASDYDMGEGYSNFSSVVTSPYRGINDIYIEGWHFRNSDNSGPNDLGPKNVNAPQEIREFYFVLNDADYKTAQNALDNMLWPSSNQEEDEAEIIHDKLSKGYGTLTIQDLKLNNLVVGKPAGIDFMKFDVELNFP